MYGSRPASPGGPRSPGSPRRAPSLPRPVIVSTNDDFDFHSPVPPHGDAFYGGRTSRTQSMRQSLYDQPEAVRVLHSKKALPSIGAAMACTVISAILSVVAAAMYNWFVVKYTGQIVYTANYGLFNAQSCSTAGFVGSNPFNTPTQNTFGQALPGTTCLTGGYYCSGDSFCSTLKSFQAFTVLACLLIFISIFAIVVFFVSIMNGHFESKISKSVKAGATGLLLFTFLCQIIAVISFAVFQNQANSALVYNQTPSLWIGNPNTSNQITQVTQGLTNIPYGSFGTYGSSFYIMIVALLFSLAGVVALAGAWRAIQRIDAPTRDFGIGRVMSMRPSSLRPVSRASISQSTRGQAIIIDGIEYVPTLQRQQPIFIDGEEYVPVSPSRSHSRMA